MFFLKHLKRLSGMHTGLVIILQFCLMSLIAPTDANAAVFNVSTRNELEAALSAAASNGEDDIIRIQQGRYSGKFIYASEELSALAIEGGYHPGFSSRDPQSGNTAIIGGGSGDVVALSSSQNSKLSIDGVEMSSGSLFIKNRAAEIKLSNCSVEDASFSSEGKIILEGNSTGNITVENSGSIEISTNHIAGAGVIRAGSEGDIRLTSSDMLSVDILKGTGVTLNGNSIIGDSANGGVSISAEDVQLTGNTIMNSKHGGADIQAKRSVKLTDNIISNNDSYSNPTVSITAPSVMLMENRIIENSAANCFAGGGGLWINYADSVIMTHNTISGNSGAWKGSGVLIENVQNLIFEGNIVSDNSAGYDSMYRSGDSSGGGLFVSSESVKLINNVISGNSTSASLSGCMGPGSSCLGYVGTPSPSSGAGAYISAQDVSIINNTIVLNRANSLSSTTALGAGIFIYGGKELRIFNNIFWNNRSNEKSGDIYIQNDTDSDYLSDSTIRIYNNNFDMSSDGFFLQVPVTVDPSNISGKDPLFTDASDNNYTLLQASPCIDSGSNSAPDLPDVDLGGGARIMNGTVDMGAYEFSGVHPLDIVASVEVGTGNASLISSFFCSVESGVAPYTFSWDFGDQSSVSYAQNPTHTYSLYGIYQAVVTVTDTYGRKSSEVVHVYLRQNDEPSDGEGESDRAVEFCRGNPDLCSKLTGSGAEEEDLYSFVSSVMDYCRKQPGRCGVQYYSDSEKIRFDGNGHYYQRFDLSTGWHQAEEICEKMGGHLVTITSAEEESFVRANFVENGSGCVWLGATDEKQEGVWKWVTGESWNFSYWLDYPVIQPDNFGGTEHYLQYWPEGWMWNDIGTGLYGAYWNGTTLYPTGFICEWDEYGNMDTGGESFSREDLDAAKQSGYNEALSKACTRIDPDTLRIDIGCSEYLGSCFSFSLLFKPDQGSEWFVDMDTFSACEPDSK